MVSAQGSRRAGGEGRFVVTDTGPDIAAAQLPSLDERCRRSGFSGIDWDPKLDHCDPQSLRASLTHS